MLTTRYVTGSPNWIDLGTPDIDGAASFYRHLFGWRFQSAGPEMGGYGFFQLDGKTAAGGMRNPPEQGPPSWNVYFQTPDTDATAKAAEHAHGSVLMQPMDVADEGRMAILADSAGVPFGLWQPNRTKGLDIVTIPGSLCWLELYTPDLPAAAGFFNSVFGWETSAVAFDEGSYTCVNPAGTEEKDMFAGLVPLDEDPTEAGSGPYWLPYFEVTDTDEAVSRAQERGGTVRAPATDMAGVGRFAKLADPYGARFAVIKSEPRQG
ncbi:VOC family protein [Streptomyces ipomoeae]|uniref:VOC family protein n=1 Tax=Streptomyces ipomoeae TaxID=103232 RepID=A0A540Q5H5_9ACTN|nr:VOC family protein [Streptomyces ipomoeae]MDX2697739.1 VOC family protein [Streptomyces ipomoeae]MDX2825225.1 VOC family protein [Streptomyces ipomoeae]MDX2843591.1 VOC family protein [Streptomyces ipomoeae]MDX2876634.1 VOC family protein [Streptomyces ipomoeae]MDX2931522.1 VOC family protein [Streptomyces ipomoeae]